MKKRNILALTLSFSLILGSAIGAFAGEPEQTELTQQMAAQNFVDMPNNWSTKALEKAVENGLLTGYNINGKQYIKADGKLTRAEMATVMNKAFNATNKADMEGVTDVAEGKWYADHMAVSVQMGGLSKAAKMRPDDQITREEAFTLLAKVFKLDYEVEIDEDDEDYYKLLDTYTDKDKISAYAKDRIAALLNAGYISGDGNKIKPQDNITRAEFAAVMNNIVEQYVNAGEVTGEVEGNIIVNAADVKLKDMIILGDVILADGIGSGDVTFENVTLVGRVLVRGGGEIKLDGDFMVVEIYQENANVVVSEDSSVLLIDSNAKGVVISGEGNVVLAFIYADNNQINTNNTSIVIEEGVTGTTSGSKTLEGGTEVESDADASSQTPPVVNNENEEDEEQDEEVEDEEQEDIE